MTVQSHPRSSSPGTCQDEPQGTSGTGARAVRVASVPASHVYVHHLTDPAGSPGVVRLPDPDPDDPRRPAASRWWPPVVLDPDWVDAHHEDFDVFHVHFGFDAIDPARLGATLDVLAAHDRPVVYTVHDLRNPHHADPAAHDAHLDVLVPRADALVTLTAGAADAVERRWGRRPQVLAHPHVVDLPTMERLQARPGRSPGELRIGVHVKSVRPSMDPLPVLETVVATLDDLPGAVLQVNGHRDVLEPGGARYEPALAERLRGWAAEGRVDLRVHDFLSDADLWDYLSSLHVSVLPYRFGTHSGWLEACRDLGTTVLAPDCGFYAEQGPVVGYHHDELGLDPGSLVQALRTAHAGGLHAPVSPSERRAQRVSVAREHEQLYRSLLP